MDAEKIKLNLCVEELLEWFDGNRRVMPWRDQADPYCVWISEVMLQQTRVETVIPYYERFIERFPSIERLAEASLDDVLRLWQGLGYYQRARNLLRAVMEVVERFHGQVPPNREAFLSLPGVGEYIAAAVLSISYNLPLAVLDGNVIRVASRFWGIGARPITAVQKQFFRKRLQEEIPHARCGDFNQAMMELGAVICRTRGWQCDLCPLHTRCYAFRNNRVAEYPGASKKKDRPCYIVALAVIRDGCRVLIQKRNETGHLGGLWEFPGGKVREGESPEQAVVRECHEEIGCTFNPRQGLTPFRHVYTHFEIEVHAFVGSIKPYEARSLAGQPLYWMDWAEKSQFAFPAANQKIFSLLNLLFKD